MIQKHIQISAARGTWVVRTSDGVIAESRNALSLAEGSYAPVIYFPREDVAMALLDHSEKETTCPHKGVAAHFSIIGQSETLENAAWSYETPKEDVDRIAHHIAFYDYLVTLENA